MLSDFWKMIPGIAGVFDLGWRCDSNIYARWKEERCDNTRGTDEQTDTFPATGSLSRLVLWPHRNVCK